MRDFLFIRHAKTAGNLERRYIGRTDEPLCGLGVQEAEALLASGQLPPIEDLEELYSGPLLRCRQTAEILFPQIEPVTCRLQEIDFGIFEGKTANELSDNLDYQQWLDTNCMGDISGGDSVMAFKQRCSEEFEQIAKASSASLTALVIHGGNIMAILEAFAEPQRDFYDYHVPNCGFILCSWENQKLSIKQQGISQ